MAEAIAFHQSDAAVSARDHRLVHALFSKPFASGTNFASRVDTRGGVLQQSGGLEVKQRGAGANMSVDVDRGVALLPGINAINQGNYAYSGDVLFNYVVTTAHATLYRKDIVVVRTKDGEYAGDNSFGIAVVSGAGHEGASAGAATTATPAEIGGTYVELAIITVRPATTSILTSDIEDRRHFVTAPGGIEVARTFESGDAGMDGWYRDLAGVLQRHNGSAWVDMLRAGAWTTYTPVTSSAGGALVVGTGGSITGRYIRMGKTLILQQVLIVGSSNDMKHGDITFTLPSGMTALTGTGEWVGTSRLFHPNVNSGGSSNWTGVCAVSGGASTVAMWYPKTPTASDTAVMRAASSAGAISTGIPDLAGEYTLDNGSFVINNITLQLT
jgi:hypothetical protein